MFLKTDTLGLSSGPVDERSQVNVNHIWFCLPFLIFSLT